MESTRRRRRRGTEKTGRVSKQGQPFGEEAFQALKGKIGGQRVRVEVRDIDRYRRAVSMVRLGNRDINRDINREMVREGFAWAYRQYLERPYASDYIQAEESARRERRGLWRQGNPQPPWEFRRLLRRSRGRIPSETAGRPSRNNWGQPKYPQKSP